MMTNREGIIRVSTSKARNEGCERVCRSHYNFHGLLDNKQVEGKTINWIHLQVFPAKDGTEMSCRLPVHPPHYLPLREHCEPLVQPEVLKVDVGHQVASPGVSNLVGDYVRI